jgi:hypothetical protein
VAQRLVAQPVGRDERHAVALGGARERLALLEARAVRERQRGHARVLGAEAAAMDLEIPPRRDRADGLVGAEVQPPVGRVGQGVEAAHAVGDRRRVAHVARADRLVGARRPRQRHERPRPQQPVLLDVPRAVADDGLQEVGCGRVAHAGTGSRSGGAVAGSASGASRSRSGSRSRGAVAGAGRRSGSTRMRREGPGRSRRTGIGAGG